MLLEQYPTDANVAATMIHTISSSFGDIEGTLFDKEGVILAPRSSTPPTPAPPPNVQTVSWQTLGAAAASWALPPFCRAPGLSSVWTSTKMRWHRLALLVVALA